jgi:hypothetical protein
MYRQKNNAMPVSTLKKINKRAKQIRAKHPGKSWKAAQKQAGKEVSSGKVGSAPRKKKRKVRKMAGHKSRVRKPAPKYYAREVHEVRRVGAISYTGGKVKISGTEDVNTAKRQLRAALGEQAGWLDVAISSERTKAGKNKLRKKKREIIAELNRIK